MMGEVRFLAGVTIGIGLGFGAAYELAGPSEAVVRVAASARWAPPAPSVAEPAAPAPPPVSEAAAVRRPLIVRYPRDGMISLDNVIIIDEGEVIDRDPRTLAEIRAALDAARRAADWAAFYAALTEAGMLGTRESEELLVEVMADESLSLEGYRTGKSFRRWLARSDVPGIVEAARRRVLIDIADEPDGSRWQAHGWLALVALRGGEADLDWLESLARDRSDMEIDVDRALAEGAGNPLAAARLSQRVKRPQFRWWRRHEALESSDPAAALAVAIESLPVAEDQAEVLRLIAEATTPDTVEATRAALLAVRERPARLKALDAVDRLRERGMDVAGFEGIVDEPRLFLERVASAPLDYDAAYAVRDAIKAISRNRVTWCDAATSAVRAFSEHENREIATAAKECLDQVARDVGRPPAWVPERSPSSR